MALVTANGAPVLLMSLAQPRVGAWQADLHVDSLTAITGAVTIVVGSTMVMHGTAVRSGEYLDTARLRVVAGVGGLGTTARPRRYRSTTVGGVLRDLLADAGESLDPVVDLAVLSTPVADWTTEARPVGAAIAELFAARAPTASWRFTTAGTFWVGVDTWPAFADDPDTFQLVSDDAEKRTARVLLDQPTILVGTTFDGRRVSYVCQTVSPDTAVAAELWFEPDGGATVDRMKAALTAIIRATPPGPDKRVAYWAKVVQQSGTSIHVVPDDPAFPDMGSVELALPPGETVEGVVGGRVLVAWSGRDRAAYAHGFQGALPAKRVIDAGVTFIGGETVAEPPPLGASLLTYLTTIAAAINALAPGSVLPPNPAALLAKKTQVA